MTPSPEPSSAPAAGGDRAPRFRYTAALAGEIETRWQEEWERRETFRQPNPGEPGFDATRPKFYCLDMFPYPSGAGLHVGHPEGYTATDIVCRLKRMQGFNVLHPMGWDAFGLPAEQYAIATGVHPAVTTRQAIDNFRRQLKRFGFCYDWSREVGTIDPEYYTWTQWIFLRLYSSWFDPRANQARPIDELKARLESGELGVTPSDDVAPRTPGGAAHDAPGIRAWRDLAPDEQRRVLDGKRLAYLGEQTVNWCPKLGTALANDEVIDGKSERGGFPVLRKPLRQWMLRITAYSQRLLDGLQGLDWPASTRTMQEEWIGRSEGAEIEFEVLGTPTLRVGECGANTIRGAGGVADPSPPGVGKSACADPAMRRRIARVAADPGAAMQPLGFMPRDPYPPGTSGPVCDLVASRRFLPHLRLEGATYIVTWRCQSGRMLDAQARSVVLDALLRIDGARCRVYAACVMPDHVHWVVRPESGVDLPRLVESVKQLSASAVNAIRGDSGRPWDADAFDHILRDGGSFAECVQYVVCDPKAAGLVEHAEAWDATFVHAEAVGETAGAETVGSPAAELPLGRTGAGRGEKPHTECGGTRSIRVFTTRPDTLFGATYMVVAPEHPLIDDAVARAEPRVRAALSAYAAWARNRSDVERQESREKTGCFTGLFARNPGTGERIPIWTADYVLMGYGFGAIMAVPAHDERDFEFAEKFSLPIRDVVYSRQALAMRFFGEHATPDEQRPEKFAAILADFLGWVSSQDVPPVQFSEAMEIIRTRRGTGTPGAAVHTHVGKPVTGRAGESGERRGVVQSTWLDTIEALGFSTFPAMRDRFDRAALAAEGPQRGADAGAGFAANSTGPELSIDDLPTREAKEQVIAWLERTGRGGRRVNFRLRDWVFSRQRYWGEPFPIVFDAEGHPHPVGEASLPVTLPALADYAPVESEEPQPLLAKATEWTHLTAGEAGVTTLPPEAPVVRETNTMPGSAGSSWYFLRYCDARNRARFASREAEGYWMGGGRAGSPGVDLYLGGSEHAVGHLLYARFWQNVLFDLGEVSTPEPFRTLFHQGLITSYAYQRADKAIVPTDEVREAGDGAFVHVPSGERVTPVVTKMSKRYKNVVNPDDVIAEFGADTFRLYEMYMGPLEASKPWNTRDIPGLFRFLARLWRLVIDEETGQAVLGESADSEVEKLLHRLGAKVEADITRLAFNTAIAACIEFVNAATSAREKRSARLSAAQAQRLALIVCPLAPHIAEELWARTGGHGLASGQAWPAADPALLRDDDVEIAVQIQGKVRHRLRVPVGAEPGAIEAMVMADPEVQKHLDGKSVKKVVVVPGRMVNIVAI
ncbi:MAG: class I tRNA ligase family protein [Phycisphaerales bacterium]|nr:class I tRNA ligase family protein [Phycisphaerales bacterium]